jgi:hypothetical protein
MMLLRSDLQQLKIYYLASLIGVLDGSSVLLSEVKVKTAICEQHPFDGSLTCSPIPEI